MPSTWSWLRQRRHSREGGNPFFSASRPVVPADNCCILPLTRLKSASSCATSVVPRLPRLGIALAFLLAGCAGPPGPDARQPQRGEAEAALQRLQSGLNRAHALAGGERILLALGSAKSRASHALARGGVLAAFMVMGQQDAVGFWNVEAFREWDDNVRPRAEARCALYARRIEDPGEIAARKGDLVTSLGDCEGDPELVRLLTVIDPSRPAAGVPGDDGRSPGASE